MNHILTSDITKASMVTILKSHQNRSLALQIIAVTHSPAPIDFITTEHLRKRKEIDPGQALKLAKEITIWAARVNCRKTHGSF